VKRDAWRSEAAARDFHDRVVGGFVLVAIIVVVMIGVSWWNDHHYLQCADGWPSTSIGRQGACSHHGGVVNVWR
jgi:hypothetical protein